MADPVVLVFPTIQDGTVVRWYRGEGAAKYGREFASASRNGVGVNMAPREVAMAAYDAHEQLAADRNADMSGLATHRLGGFGDLVPVTEPVKDEPKPFRISIADRFGGHPR